MSQFKDDDKIICKGCHKLFSFYGHSYCYCEHCFSNRKKANKKYNELHKIENYHRTLRWLKKHPKKVIEYAKKYRSTHKELVAKLNREYKKTEKSKNSQKRYAEINKEKINKRSREWQKDNQEHRRQYLIEWRIRNPNKSAKYTKKYRDKNIEHCRKRDIILNHKRKAQMKINGGSHTLSDWENILKLYGSKCLACGSTENITVDHVIPIVLGGSNAKDNLQPLCFSCNCKKHTKIIDYRVAVEIIT